MGACSSKIAGVNGQALCRDMPLDRWIVGSTVVLGFEDKLWSICTIKLLYHDVRSTSNSTLFQSQRQTSREMRKVTPSGAPRGGARKCRLMISFLTDKWGNMTAVLNLPRTKVSSNADIADVPCRRSKHNLMAHRGC
jgi:hypothetical protein